MTDCLSVYVRLHLVGLSAVPAALRLFHTMTRISTNATSASTSSSRFMATCHCCTRSFEWTLCCLRLVYPMTRPSASSSSSIGLSGPAKSQTQSGLKDWRYLKERHCEQQGRWMDCQIKAQEESLRRKLTLKSVGLWSNPQLYWKFEEWKLKGTTAKKISFFSGCHSSFFMFFNHAQSSTTTDVFCTS